MTPLQLTRKYLMKVIQIRFWGKKCEKCQVLGNETNFKRSTDLVLVFILPSLRSFLTADTLVFTVL